MTKIVGSSEYIGNVWAKVMAKVKNTKLCNPNAKERVVHCWRFDGRPAHAGQVYGEKVLPNGNIQKRITTAYAGSEPTIAIDTRVYSPSGELLKAYHGIRGCEVTYKNGDKVIHSIAPTRAYGGGADVAKLIQSERQLNPEIKALPL